MIPQKLIDENPELREPIIKAYMLGYDSGWRDLRRRADFVIAALAMCGIAALLMAFHLLGVF